MYTVKYQIVDNSFDTSDRLPLILPPSRFIPQRQLSHCLVLVVPFIILNKMLFIDL